MQTRERIRTLLLSHPAGLTVGQIGKQLGLDPVNASKRLKGAYGCYVLRWEGMRQVWACVPVPQHAKAPYRHPKLKEAPPPAVPYIPQKTVWREVKPW